MGKKNKEHQNKSKKKKKGKRILEPPDELRSCGFLIVHGKPIQEFLLMVHANRLDLPKGHTEPGESDLECALRELEEETGITEHDIAIDPSFSFSTRYEVSYKKFDRQPIPKTTVIFMARLKTKVEIEITEHIGFRWEKWDPPHSIQAKTIDPLLAAAAKHVERSST